jgi:transposase
LIRKKVRHDSTIYSDTWRGYTGIADRWYVHRLVKHNKEVFSDKRGGYINSLEGFWGYLKRNLASKGGIHRERLSLYLAEYVWRFNHRRLSIEEQVRKLLNLLKKNRYEYNNYLVTQKKCPK